MAPGKKNSSNRMSSSLPTTIHPPYFQMIRDAIATMKDRPGSSQPSIAKFIEENYTNMLQPNFRKMLSVQLKRFVQTEKLIKVKNSYKISASEKGKIASTPAKESSRKKKETGNENVTKAAVTRKVVEKAKRTKRLSQVKTPEVMKKKTQAEKGGKVSTAGGKMKDLSQVKTPDGMKKKKKIPIPMKRKAAAKSVKPNSTAAAKKARSN